MSRRTPPIGISGTFILRAPFSVASNQSYTVVAIRSFSELIARQQDPLRLVYEPVGLTNTAYRADQILDALIVCLRDKSGMMTYVPDSYIERFPSMGSIPYNRIVVGVSLGMWPENRSTVDIERAIAESVQSKIGVSPDIFISRSALSEHVSEQEHAQITQARQSAITNRETSTAVINRLSDTIAVRDATIQEQQLLIEALVGEIDALRQ